MESDSCGPSSSLQRLAKHSQRDNSLQQDVARNRSSPHASSFRSQPFIDQRLSEDFNQFSRSNDFMAPAPGLPAISHGRGDFQAQGRDSSQGWVQRFSLMNIAHTPPQKSVDNRWQDQFIQQNSTNITTLAVQNPQNLQGFGVQQSYVRPSMGMFQLSLHGTQQSNVVTEHRELHDMKQDDDMFDEKFLEIERELLEQESTLARQADPEEGYEIDQSQIDKDAFAKTAGQVQESLLKTRNSEINEKLKNSNFLKLMNSISSRSIELSSDGSKLVNASTGEEVKNEDFESLKAPEMNTQSYEHAQSGSYHDPRHEEHERLVSHLPDPLAHLKDGDLSDVSSPLQAARIISGDQVKTSDWMEGDDFADIPNSRMDARHYPNIRRDIMSEGWREVYDDYRNDDDIH